MVQAVTIKCHHIIRRATSDFCDFFHIAQFWYNRVDDRGLLTGYSNHPAWTEYFASENLHQKCPLLCHSKYLKEGISIFDDSINSADEHYLNDSIIDVFYKDKMKYKSNIWVIYIKKTKTGSEQFGFFINKKALSLFFSEQELVKLFMNKAPEISPLLFSKLEDNQINLIEELGNSFYQGIELNTPNLTYRQKLIEKLGLKIANKLSNKEIEVIKLVLQGYSASAIAPQVFLAKRTVDHILERIKDKMECNSKTQLIIKARELEKTGFFLNG